MLGVMQYREISMELVNKVVLDSMVRLVRQVPWGPSRDKLLARSNELSAEGSFERGWDNYTTAARLGWEAGLYRLAGEARFPHEGDNQVAAMRDSLLYRLVDEVSMKEDDDDVGEVTRIDRWELSMALAPSIDENTIEVLVDELAAAGLLDDSPDFLKSLHAEEAARNAAIKQPSTQLGF
ncbi:hypothetical protein O9X98_05810 [Agrobacterium salinitolerans]|nr:hypothetical protein [Agrobacterium salinitolerans]